MSLVAVITGASSGIGEAAARRLAHEPGAELVLVARREERLRELADSLPAPATYVAADLTDPDAPDRIAAHLGEHNVRRTMDVNFDSVVRLTEAVLPLLRASSPSAIVNVASTAARVARAGAGAYSASKFALAGWTDALHLEERPHGVHVGLVLPGFVAPEGFPAEELRAKRLTGWMVSDADTAAEAIVDAGLRGRAERYVPRPYAFAAAARAVVPSLLRRAQRTGAASVMTTRTGADATAGP